MLYRFLPILFEVSVFKRVLIFLERTDRDRNSKQSQSSCLVKKCLIYMILFIVYPIVSKADFKNDKCRNSFLEREDEFYNWMSYREVQQFVKEINIKTKKAFFEFALSEDKPDYFPLNPNKVYEEWTSWEDFLGVESAGEAQTNDVTDVSFLKHLGGLLDLDIGNTEREVDLYSRKREQSIELLNRQRKKSVKDSSLQKNNRTRNNNWMSYKEAKEFIRALRITSTVQFNKWSRSKNRPFNFPSSPYSVYKKEWQGWRSFLGSGRIIVKNWMSYEEAKTFIQNEKVDSETTYRKWKKEGKRPINFPAHPDRKYKEHWKGWGEFLGNVKKKKPVKMTNSEE